MVTPVVAEAALHEQKDLLKHLFQIDEHGSFGFAIEAQHGAADLGDAGQLLLGHVHELHPTPPGGAVAHEVEQVGDGVERVVDLVGDGGGQASGDGELLICQQRVLGLAFHGDVAEDQDDAGDAVCAVANGRAAVGDIQLCLVFADEDRMVAEADDAVQPLYLGDWIFHGLAGRLVDDMEDRLERLSLGFGLGPSGELDCDRDSSSELCPRHRR